MSAAQSVARHVTPNEGKESSKKFGPPATKNFKTVCTEKKNKG